jgi:hypothetical protein
MRFPKNRFRAKAILLVTLFFIFCAAASAQNHQKIYPLDSPVYSAIRGLYISRGLALPSTTGPWSEDELLMMLHRLDGESLEKTEAAMYFFAQRELTRTASFFETHGRVNLELRGHADGENFLIPSDYIRPWNLARNFFDLDLEGRITDHAYGLFTVSLGNNIFNRPVEIFGPTGSKMVGSAFFGTTKFSTNIPLVKPATLGDLNLSFPSRSFASLGGYGWNFVLGRDRLSWGPGESGNLLVGSHIEYHDNARLLFYNDAVKYTFNVSAFPYPDEYYDVTASPHGKAAPVQEAGDTNSFSGAFLFIAHRFEWRIVQNRLNMALTEAIVYDNENGYVDATVLSPFMFLHNLYRRKNSNSILSLEVDFSPLKRFNVYGAVVMDEFGLGGGEPTPGKDDDAHPDGFGFLAGIKAAFPMETRPALLSLSLEGVWTSPYLYLRTSFMGNGNRGLNFVTATRYFSITEDENYYNEDFLGYRWGGDVVLVNARATYEVFGSFSLTGNFMFMAHGTFDKYTIWSAVHVTKPPYDAETPTTSHPGESSVGNENTETTGNYADPHADQRDAVQYTSALSLLGSWNFWRNLSAYGQIDFVFVTNPRNIRSNPPAQDVQYTLGLSYSF